MKKFVLNVLVVGFLFSGNAFAEGTCQITPGAWGSVVAEFRTMVTENNYESYKDSKSTNFTSCYQSAVTAAQQIQAQKKNSLNFVSWSFQEPSQVSSQGKFTVIGARKYGIVDAKSNYAVAAEGDQRFLQPGVNFWLCVFNFVSENGQPQSNVIAKIKNKGQQQESVLTSKVLNSFFVRGANEAEGLGACRNITARNLVKINQPNVVYSKADYFINSTTSLVASLATTFTIDEKNVTFDEALDMQNGQNLQASNR